MIRLLFYIFIVLVLGIGFAWLADRPGDLVITWQDRQIEMSLMVAASAVAVVIGVILFGWWLIHAILVSPQTVSRYFRARKRDRGYQALSTGLIAAGAGDALMARKMAKRTMGLLSADQEPLIHLLDAQAALIEGRSDEARAKFEAMAEDPETRELGLRGLYLEARKAGADEAARHYAERAAEHAPQLPWAAEATLAYKSAEGAWDDAIGLLEKQRIAKTVTKEDADRKKAVLLTARGMDKLEGGDVAGARTDGLEAHRLAANLVPAAVLAATALYRENNLRKGSSLLEKAWKANPHPEIAEAYVRARPGDSTHDRLKRAKKLESIKRNNVESLFVVARAALDARELDLARQSAEAAARIKAREGIYLLLADIEEADTGDQGRIRHWLAQAVRAPRDEAWTADGYVAEEWAPVSPVTGRLDAFEWRVPVEQIAGPVEQAEATRLDAERAIESLPPVAIVPVAEPVDDSDIIEAETIAEEAKPDGKADAEPMDAQPDDVPDVKPVDSAEPEPAEEQPVAGTEPENEALSTAKPDEAETKTAKETVARVEPVKKQDTIEVEPAVKKAASVGSTHIVTDAVGKRDDRGRDLTSKPLDDPGVDDSEEDEEQKSRFRLF